MSGARRLYLCLALVSAPLIFSAAARAGDERDLDSYMLASDAFVTRPADAADVVFYASNPKDLTAKLGEYGQKFPDNFDFPQGGLFILVVSDRVQEAFDKMSSVDAKHILIVNLNTDKDAQPPKTTEKDKKTSRLLLICCAPRRDIEGFAIEGADGVRHDVHSEKIKKQ
jgi:hypothetical protein